ncbi:MAG TPA: hypothetical protein VKE22_10315 [Haliangiales bacterium]|nr:hypothetical protein [Haliangiales bacterium]
MLRTLVAAAALAACAKETVSPPPADKPAPPPAQPAPPQLETRDIVVKHVDDQAAVRARVPSDWVGSGQSFRPPREMDGYPILAFDITCNGACDAATLPKNLVALVKGTATGAARPNLNTGDPALDAVRLDAAVVDEGEWKDGGYQAVRVTRPAGLTGPYRDELVARCARTHPGVGAFVHAFVRAPVSAEKTLWPLLLEACKTWAYN